MARVNIRPAPGYVIVLPGEEKKSSAITSIQRIRNNPEEQSPVQSLSKGTVMRLPYRSQQLKSEKLSGSPDFPLKEGDVIIYVTDDPWEITIGEQVYHMVSDWSIKGVID